MKKIFRASLYFLIIIVLEMFAPIPLSLIYNFIGLTDIKIILFLNHTILFLLPALIYFIATKASVRKTLRLNKLGLVDALIVILIGFLAYPVTMFFSLLSNLVFENNIQNLFTDIMNSPYIILLLLMAVMPAITEEITMRGIVLSGYDFKNKYVAAIITGILFGVLHLDMQQFLYAAVLGILLALLVRITDSILASCIVHFVINGTSVTLQKLISNLNSNVIEQSPTTSLAEMPTIQIVIAIVFYGIFAIIFGALIFLLIKKLESRNKDKIGNIILAKGDGVEKEEKILNVPLIATVIVFTGYMLLVNTIFI